MSVKPIPEGFHSLTVYMGVSPADKAIDFYKKAFGAEELFRLDGPGGRVGHAELQIGDSRLMVSEPCDQGGFVSPDPGGKTSFGMHLYVLDVDQQFKRAVGHVLRRPQRQRTRPFRPSLVHWHPQGRPHS